MKLQKNAILTWVVIVFISYFAAPNALAAPNPETSPDKGKQEGIITQLFSPFGTRYWNPSISGNVKVNGNNLAGDRLDLKSDMGLEMKGSERSSAKADAVGLETPDSKFRFGFEYYHLKGDSQLDRNIQFQNGFFSAGEIASTLRVKYLTVSWLPHYQSESNNVSSPVFGLIYFGHKQKLADSQQRYVKEFDGLIPTIGYRVENNRFGDIVSYAETSVYPSKNYYYNVEAGLVRRFGKLAIGAGYRVCAQKITDKDDKLEFKAKGPFVQALYKF